MQVKYPDCRCEDYPCCGHYDIVYGDEQMANYCDICGTYHSVTFDCQDYEDDDYDGDDENCDCGSNNCYICSGDKEENESRQRVNAFGQALRADAPVLPGDHYGDDPFDERDYE